MQKNNMTYAVIKSAVKKGVCDIKDHPRRGLRNLVDLGEFFAGGRFQKDFFKAAQQALGDKDSPYYRLMDRVVKTTDPELLTTFGINLGYNAWTTGAKTIRRLEQTQGFNIPWTILFHMGHEAYMRLDAVADTIRQGKELGIYCYMLYIDESYPEMGDLLKALKYQSDCAFVLFVHPAMLGEEVVEKIHDAKNILVNLDMDCDEDVSAMGAKTLKRHGCLYGGFTRCKSMEKTVKDSALFSRAETLGQCCLFLMRTKKSRPGSEGGNSGIVGKLRKHPKHAVFPIDFHRDIAHVDRNISSQACLCSIARDGAVAVTNVDHRANKTCYNIQSTPLKVILEQTMPKRTTPPPWREASPVPAEK